MDRKIYATVSAILRFHKKELRVNIEDIALDVSFSAHRSHPADFEDVEVLQVKLRASEPTPVADAKVRLIVRADTELDFEQIMQECSYSFKLGGHRVGSELTGWTVDDSK